MDIGIILIVLGIYTILLTIQIFLIRIDDKADLIMKDLGIERKSNIKKIIERLKDGVRRNTKSK